MNTNILLNSYPEILSVEHLREILGIGRNKAYNLVRNQEIKSIKIGSTIRIPKAWLIEFIENKCYNNRDKTMWQAPELNAKEGFK